MFKMFEQYNTFHQDVAPMYENDSSLWESDT